MTGTSTCRLVGAATLLVFVLATNYSTCRRQDAHALTNEPLVQTVPVRPEHDIDHDKSSERPDTKTENASTKSKTTPTPDTESPTPRCNEATEFHCQMEDCCVPLEWRCDFTEQCLSGQDELGCVTDWCNFDRDYCYWIPKLDGITQPAAAKGSSKDSHPTATYVEKSTRPLFRSSFWRRFPPAAKRLRDPNTLVADLLDSLSLNSAARAKFIFVALQLDEQDLIALDDQAERSNKLVKRAQIATPQIGRTNSQCQLRFEFALWNPSRSPHLKSSLSLVAHSADSNTSRALWMRASDESARGAGAGAGAIDWTVGVAELGYLSRVELSFEARLIANLPAARQKSAGNATGDQSARHDLRETWLLKQRPVNTTSAQLPTVGSNQLAEQVAFEGAIVALRWLKFHDCRWPRGDSIISSLNKNIHNRGQELPLDGLVPAAVDELEQETCSRDEFQCSSGLCVAKQRLCNFVDDCMNSAGPEDEAQRLCAPLADTSETFDSAPLGSKHMQLFLTSQVEKFWHLNGNWTISRTSVRSNALALSHLPRLDHTNHKSSGRFLSLEVPQAYELGPPGNQRKLFWAAINSRWMEKPAGELEGDECRVKFFYNLVSSHPRDLYQNSSLAPFKFSLVVAHHKMRPRFECAGDPPAEDYIELGSPIKQIDAFIHSQQIDGWHSLKLQPEVVEYPGVDFWREANVRLWHLEPGDLFYIRLLVFVEFTGEPMGQHKASINFDDLSTHFGCGGAVDTGAGGPRQERHFDDELSDLLNPKKTLGQLTAPYNPMRNRLKRTNYNQRPADNGSDEANGDKLIANEHSNSHRVEAQKLVAYVSGALLVMMGVIAIIVFVLVPHVERAMMSYQDQIQLSLSGEISDLPISQGTIYDLSAGSSNAQRACRPRTWSFDSINTTTGFSSAPVAANKRCSQHSIASSTNSSQDGYFEAETNFDHQLTGPKAIIKNLNSQAQHSGNKAASGLVIAADTLQPKSIQELDEEFNSSAFSCIQNSSSFDGSTNDLSSSWQVHSEPLYEPPTACEIRRPSESGPRKGSDTPDQRTTR